MITVKRVPSYQKQMLEKIIKDLSTTVAKVGWLEAKRYPHKTSSIGPTQPLTVAEVAYLNEKGIYARPFIRPTITREKNNWGRIAFNKSRDMLKNGNTTVHDMFEAIGDKTRFDIQKTIKQLWDPPLKPSTIRARINKYSNDPELKLSTRKSRQKQLNKFIPSGLYKPLIDTSLMFSTITHSVENE